MKVRIRLIVAASLLAANAMTARALSFDCGQSQPYLICQWVCTHGGGWAQGCMVWIFSTCGGDSCGDKPTGCDET